jgi:hypothetical protein
MKKLTILILTFVIGLSSNLMAEEPFDFEKDWSQDLSSHSCSGKDFVVKHSNTFYSVYDFDRWKKIGLSEEMQKETFSKIADAEYQELMKYIPEVELKLGYKLKSKYPITIDHAYPEKIEGGLFLDHFEARFIVYRNNKKLAVSVCVSVELYFDEDGVLKIKRKKRCYDVDDLTNFKM